LENSYLQKLVAGVMNNPDSVVCTHFWVGATAKQQQSNSKATANPPKSE
jgi:hypothetical protein